jgi:hypothetical protein
VAWPAEVEQEVNAEKDSAHQIKVGSGSLGGGSAGTSTPGFSASGAVPGSVPTAR